MHRSPGQDRAVLLLHGLLIHPFSKINVNRAGLHSWQKPDSMLVKRLAAEPLAHRFSQRFLREMLVFPFQSAEGEPTLAVADPSDLAAAQAAGIVLGGNVKIQVASFEDIETALDQRVGNEVAAPDAAQDSGYAREDDIESLRDLASGAPVVRARIGKLRISDTSVL